MMRMKIGETDVEVTWEDNESVEALKELARAADRRDVHVRRL